MQKAYIINGFADNSYLGLEDATNVATEIVNTRKQEHYDQLVTKLNNLKTSFKTFVYLKDISERQKDTTNFTNFSK